MPKQQKKKPESYQISKKGESGKCTKNKRFQSKGQQITIRNRIKLDVKSIAPKYNRTTFN